MPVVIAEYAAAYAKRRSCQGGSGDGRHGSQRLMWMVGGLEGWTWAEKMISEVERFIPEPLDSAGTLLP